MGLSCILWCNNQPPDQGSSILTRVTSGPIVPMILVGGCPGHSIAELYPLEARSIPPAAPEVSKHFQLSPGVKVAPAENY